MEKASILHLVDAVFLVIACGGGIPVVKQGEGSYVGVLAVIDKDYASECLAEIIDAEYLYILTAVDRVCINFNKPDQKEIKEMSCRKAEAKLSRGTCPRKHAAQGQGQHEVCRLQGRKKSGHLFP